MARKSATKKVAKKKIAPKKPVKKKAAPKKAAAKKTVLVTALNVGDTAPAFTLPDENGQSVSLGDFRGKKVVLYFYPKDDTPGCTQESCDFRDSFSRVKAAGAVVLGMSKDSVESHRKFKQKYSLPFPLLADVGGKTIEAYGVWQEKSLYGRKFMGIVRTTVLIDEQGKVRKIYPKVKVEGHVSQVLQDLA